MTEKHETCPECGAPAEIAPTRHENGPEYRYLPSPSLAWLQAEARRWAGEKGWIDDRGVGDLMMLMVTELAEAYEEYRDWHEPAEIRIVAGKPEGIPIELADVVIRILSFCGKFEIDLQEAVLQKMAFNETRPHRHGGKRV